MAQKSTLLSHMVARLTSRGEDAATDALAYVLNRSQACLEAFNAILRTGELQTNPIARIRTQVVGRSGSRPDMAGYDAGGAKRLLVEVKFWAGLRGTQVADYLEQLAGVGPAGLLFIAPERRLETLWAEIQGRFDDETLPGSLVGVGSNDGIYHAAISRSEVRIALVSWTLLLSRLLDSVKSAREHATEADIEQLQGLTVSQDDEAFLPLHSEDFSALVPRRILQYQKLVADAVVARGNKEGWITVGKLRPTGTWFYRGRYFRFTDSPGALLLCVHYGLWQRFGATPIWLGIAPKVPIDLEKLAAYCSPVVNEVHYDYNFVPIRLPTRVEYPDVLDDVASQLKTIRGFVEIPVQASE